MVTGSLDQPTARFISLMLDFKRVCRDKKPGKYFVIDFSHMNYVSYRINSWVDQNKGTTFFIFSPNVPQNEPLSCRLVLYFISDGQISQIYTRIKVIYSTSILLVRVYN